MLTSRTRREESNDIFVHNVISHNINIENSSSEIYSPGFECKTKQQTYYYWYINDDQENAYQILRLGILIDFKPLNLSGSQDEHEIQILTFKLITPFIVEPYITDQKLSNIWVRNSYRIKYLRRHKPSGQHTAEYVKNILNAHFLRTKLRTVRYQKDS
ncbi:hypothetical protein BpHYR1_045294 [Brachionus plicatilis]|uniref:Uncharacterized protein n=1 Tax=Brachionus plicatilis TaxID=10195 RepID=A0A3M7SMU8_BRAPC|nr:hypothetical protein BpHYR1_045294 [Brachionus plicatilis]